MKYLKEHPVIGCIVLGGVLFVLGAALCDLGVYCTGVACASLGGFAILTAPLIEFMD